MKKITLFMAVLCIAITNAFSQNLALNKTATASTGDAALAVDENTGSRWESAHEDPQWIAIDLEQSYNIGQVVLNWEGAYGKVYEIQVSENGTDWTTIHSETNSDGGIDDILVTGTGRYVRMYGTERGTPWGYSLWEMEIYEAAAEGKDASLTSLSVDGINLEGFSNTMDTYIYAVADGTIVIPTVVATTTDINASTQITDAASIPGTTTVLVTSQDETVTKTFYIEFIIGIPGAAAPTPTHDETNVISVYSDFYTSIATNLNPGWGQSTVFEEVQFDGNNTLKYGNLDYQGMEYTNPTDVSDMEYIHLDYFTGDATSFEFYLIADGENAYNINSELGITTGEWVGIDIPLSHYADAGRDLTAAFQFKTTGNGTIYMDNLYFWKSVPTAINNMDELNFSISPNPASNYLNINASEHIEMVEIFDLTGKSVLKETSKKLDVSSLTQGVYLVKVQIEGIIKTTKFIKK
ncbi:T9SS type A sorting domain-containing protein [Labilibacter sediminis]|nr:T9SS type A sorting domain-containing protein [Labilibacter sediminis]